MPTEACSPPRPRRHLGLPVRHHERGHQAGGPGLAALPRHRDGWMTGQTLSKVAQLIDALVLMDPPLSVLAVARLEAALPKSNLGLTREQEGAVGAIQLSLALWQPDSRGKPL